MNIPVSVRVILVVLALLFLILPETAKAVIFTIGLLLWGFFGWRGSIRRRQLVSGTPTSKVATAAKGYAEFRGRARNALPIPLRDPITNTTCVWFHVETEKFDFGKWRWRTVGSVQSGRPFALEDETGLCLVLPQDARLLTRPAQRVKERLTLRHNVQAYSRWRALVRDRPSRTHRLHGGSRAPDRRTVVLAGLRASGRGVDARLET